VLRPERGVAAPIVLGASFVAGAIPFSGLAARLVAGVDLRERGSGTVSGTGLYDVAGFGPLAIAGSLDVAKGTVGPLLARRDRPLLAALAAGLGIVGHNWSPALRGAGGRGISPALGVTLVLAPEGMCVLGAGLAVGRLVRQSGLGTFVGLLCLFPVLKRAHGREGTVLAAGIAVPMLTKRLFGNRPPRGDDLPRILLSRLLFDHDGPVGDESAEGGKASPRAPATTTHQPRRS
jgi:acyl phosphate:glycerol-3-phosphate acyltransferase